MPLYASIELFIHLLRDPTAPNAQADLTLLEIGSGHFARLEFTSDSYMSIPFVRDITQIARNAVEVHKNAPSQAVTDSSAPDGTFIGRPPPDIGILTPQISVNHQPNEEVSQTGLYVRSVYVR